MPDNSERKALFDHWSESYPQAVSDGEFPFIGYEQTLDQLIQHANIRNGHLVLDLGIGTGALGVRLSIPRDQIWGVDFSAAMLEKAGEVLPGSHLLQLDLLSDYWPEELNQPFDRIISGYTFHEFTDDQKLAILSQLTANQLAKNGVIYIADISFLSQADFAAGYQLYRCMGRGGILLVRRSYAAEIACAGIYRQLHANIRMRRDLQAPDKCRIIRQDNHKRTTDLGRSNRHHPERYHGFNAQPPFFEGWYFKLVSQDGKHRLAVIPGIYLSEDPEKRHAFIQIFDSEAEAGAYIQLPYQDFSASPDAFEVLIGPNFFSAEKLILDINDQHIQAKGELTFSSLSPWPVHFTSPGAMGWFAWVPFMECYHGVVSLDHVIQGSIGLNGNELDFTNGRGFIEKDWGRQFPSAWIWGQCNHFDRPGTSLMMSVAVIPWLGNSFGGFIVGFLHDGVLHRFTTYNGARIEQLELDDSWVRITFRNRTHRLRVEAQRAVGGLLQAPTMESMDRRILESLNASFRVQLENLDGQILYHSVGEYAGLEVVGDQEQLITKVNPH